MVETERGKLFMPPDIKDFGVSDPDMIRWVNSKMTPDPFGTWTDILHLRNESALARSTVCGNLTVNIQ